MPGSSRRSLEKAVERACTPQQRHLAYEDLGSFLTERREYKEALMCYEVALKEAEKLGDELKIAKAHRMIGQNKTELAQYEGAITHLQKYLELTITSGDEFLVEQQRAYTSLGRTYFLIADLLEDDDSKKTPTLQLSITYTSRSLMHCDKLDERQVCSRNEVNNMRAVSLLNLGLAQEMNGKLDQGVDIVQLALRISKSLQETSLTCRCLGALVTMYVKKNMASKVLELSEEGFQVCKKLPGSERVSATCSFLVSQADAYLLNMHFRQARKKLHSAYKLANPDGDIHATTEKKLKTVVAMERQRAELRNLADEKYAERAKCNELLGDAYSSMDLYKIALLFYEDQLTCLIEGDLDLRLCYASLGQTAKDCGFYEKAIAYFEKEIELCRALEASSSYLSIGHCQRLAGMAKEDYMKSFRMAYKKAVECGNKRMQINSLKILEEHVEDEDEADKTRELLEQLQESSSSQSSDDEKNTPDFGDDVDVEQLSDCDGSSDEDVQGQRLKEHNRHSPFEDSARNNRPRRKPRRQVALWRNPQGETKLHLACMNGNLKNAKIFLREGCDINVEDYAGWTPLHEACNHGHLDIVRFLLESGADINNSGGKDVRGLTPLHDAASAGNFDVINFLLDYNASVTKTTDDGDTVLDMLEEFYDRTMEKEGFSELDAQSYQHVKDRIVDLMNKAGMKRDFKPRTQVKTSQLTLSRTPTQFRNSNHNKTIGDLRTTADNLDDSYKRKRTMRPLSPIRRSPLSSRSSRSSSPPSDEENSRRRSEEAKLALDYKKVMLDLQRKNTGNEVVRAPCKPVQPLLDEDDVVDEWLDDDMGINHKKKRKMSRESEVDEFFTQRRRRSGESRRQTAQKLSLSLSEKVPSFNESGRRSFDKEKSSRSSTPMDFECNDENVDLNASVMFFDDEDTRNRSPSPRRMSSGSKPTKLGIRRVKQASLHSLGFDRYSPPPFSSTQVSAAPPPYPQAPPPSQPLIAPMHRVNVKIDDHLLAVPVSSLDLSIGWLADEASNRYYKIEGVKPTLRLKTQDGALLCHEDPVSLLIGGGDIVGDVTSFNLPPIATRYEEACEQHGVELDVQIAQDLEASQATHQLRIANATLAVAILKPVIRAIAMEHLLQRLDLSQNCLRDEGVLELCEHSLRLVHLQELDLSGNMITSQGVLYLAEAVKSGKLKSLIQINLNYNDLGNGAVVNLAKLTSSLPDLVALFLAACGFTRNLWEQGNNLHLSNIQVLDLSCNALHARGLSGFLGNNQPNSDDRLNPDRLRTLLLVGVKGTHFCRELRQFLERGQNPALMELHLTAPEMTDEDLADLLSGLQNATKFTSLRLLSASSLTARGLYSLLVRHPPMQQLEIQGGDNLMYEVHDTVFENDIYEAVKSAARAMEVLTIKSPFTKAENNLSTQLETAWREVCREDCTVKRSSKDLLRLSRGCY